MHSQAESEAMDSLAASRFARAAGTMPTAGTYILDLTRSTLGFRAKAFCLKWVSGTLRPTSGEIVIDGGTVRGHGSADATAVDTKLRPRDWHLRTSHYLNTARHPEVRFRVERCDLAAREGEGVLDVRGRQVSIPLVIHEASVDGDELRMQVSGSFDRRGLGMLPRMAGVSRMVHLNLDLVATTTKTHHQD
jgi:polyisoprenoid-binding protein YceI